MFFRWNGFSSFSDDSPTCRTSSPFWKTNWSLNWPGGYEQALKILIIIFTLAPTIQTSRCSLYEYSFSSWQKINCLDEYSLKNLFIILFFCSYNKYLLKASFSIKLSSFQTLLFLHLCGRCSMWYWIKFSLEVG